MMASLTKVIVVIEGEMINREVTLTYSNGVTETYYAIEGSFRYGFGPKIDSFVNQSDLEKESKLDELCDYVYDKLSAPLDSEGIKVELDPKTGNIVDVDQYG